MLGVKGVVVAGNVALSTQRKWHVFNYTVLGKWCVFPIPCGMLLKLWTVAAWWCACAHTHCLCRVVSVCMCLYARAILCRDTLCLKHSALHSIPYSSKVEG